MMIDLATMRALELIQNLQNAKSRDCLFGLLNQTLTPMGSRVLKSSVLQPSTDRDVLEKRWDALYELTIKEDVFFAIRQGNIRISPDYRAISPLLKLVIALKAFVDVDRVLTAVCRFRTALAGMLI